MGLLRKFAIFYMKTKESRYNILYAAIFGVSGCYIIWVLLTKAILNLFSLSGGYRWLIGGVLTSLLIVFVAVLEVLARGKKHQ